MNDFIKAASSPPPLPRGWAWATVARVGHCRTGLQKSPERERGNFPTKYLRAANVTRDGIKLDDVFEMDITPSELDRFSLLPGDVLLVEGSGTSGQLGRAAIWEGQVDRCSFQNHLIRFRPHAVVPKYAWIVFKYLQESGSFATMGRGVGIQHLGKSRLESMPFPLPPLREQERIVSEFDKRTLVSEEAQTSLRSALANIELQIGAILEATADGSLIHSDINRDSESGGPSNSRSPGQWGLGLVQLPSEWSWRKVGDIGEVKLGRQRSPRYERGPHMCPYLRVANVLENRIDSTDVHRMNFSPDEQKIYRLNPNDILLNEGQSPELVGRPAMYEGVPPNCMFQNHLIRFRAREPVSSHYALLVFRHYFRSGEFTAIARWTTNIASLGAKRFAALAFPVPPIAHQKDLVREANRRLDATEHQRTSAANSLENLRLMQMELLKSAVTGRLVPQIEEEEPADALLARIGTPTESVRKTARDLQQEKTMAMPHFVPPLATKDLIEILRQLGGKSSAEELFVTAGFDRDSTEAIEGFYLSLRRHLRDGALRLVKQKDSWSIVR
jgi:type I restriction enzyme S subunit